mgnify:CR=1 FL=1
MDNRTQINNQIMDNNKTEINPSVGIPTKINYVLAQDKNELFPGTLLSDKYFIESKLNVSTGEADLYICTYSNTRYVAKIYRRQVAIKDKVICAIKDISCPFVAKIYDTGIIDSMPFEVIPFYENGSLEGRKYSFNELKKHIIPSLNEGLHSLHQKEIIHKDLKPSNIMLCNNKKDVAIIDFGISSIRDNGNTVVVTKTGMTPEYSAPETFRNLYLEESDYYSLGITIYELFFGHTPYKNMDRDSIEKYVSVQRIPFPKDAPSELCKLISALTYYDITNRKDKANPNRRWTYEEVKKWYIGEQLEIPGEGLDNKKTNIPIPYTFLKKEYHSLRELVIALATHWNDGKKQLFRGLLSGFFKGFNPELAGYCMDSEDEMQNGANEDIVFFKTSYKIDPDIRQFFWKGNVYNGLNEFGATVLEELHKEKNGNIELFFEVLSNNLLSTYLSIHAQDDKDLISAVSSLESEFTVNAKTERDKKLQCYLMGYMLSGKKDFFLENDKFESINDFAQHLKNLIEKSYEQFEELCNNLLDKEENLDVQLEAWLIAIGKRKELEQWRQRLRG